MKYLLLTILSFTFSLSATSKVVLFDNEEVIHASLEMDLSDFRTNRENYREKGIKGVFKVENKTFNVEVLSRGHGSFDNINTPFKLIFDKEQRKGSLFDGIKKIKAFVAADQESYYERVLLSNYLTYKLVEKLTPVAFKTRLFKINYIDTSGKIPPYISTTFLKEPNKNLAKRTNSTYTPMKIDHTIPLEDIKARLDLNIAYKVAALEFLIGNFDHAIPGMSSIFFNGIARFEKNMKMFLTADQRYIPVPYDFDFAGSIDRGNCMWEIGIGIMRLERSDHMAQMKYSKCKKHFIKKHILIDLESYKYKQSVLDNKDHFIQSMRSWKEEYSEEMSTLSKDYLGNIEAYLGVLEEL